jgi:hypothetical protein
MLENNSSRFYLPEDKIVEHRARVDRKNFVLIALTTLASIYVTGITLSVLI